MQKDKPLHATRLRLDRQTNGTIPPPLDKPLDTDKKFTFVTY